MEPRRLLAEEVRGSSCPGWRGGAVSVRVCSRWGGAWEWLVRVAGERLGNSWLECWEGEREPSLRELRGREWLFGMVKSGGVSVGDVGSGVGVVG